MTPHLLLFVAALLASLLITPAVIRVAHARKLYDTPTDPRRVHTRPIPRLGGIAVFGATALGLLGAWLGGTAGLWLTTGYDKFFLGILLGGSVLFATGLIDDLRGLRPSVKLVVQTAAALIVYFSGFEVSRITLGAESNLAIDAWLSPLITVLWIVGVTNAFNLIDGLDGLATGIALVALTTTLAVAATLGNVEVVVVCTALIGALVGFLRYNFNPARIFLGDSGSLFIGFMLAVLSVHGSMKSATAVLVIVPLFALALPLMDTLFAIVRRWLRGVPLSGADARHVHHRLLALGLTQRRAVLTLYVVASGLAVIGLSMVFAPPTAVFRIAILGGILLLLLVLYGVRRLDYHEIEDAGTVLASGVMRIRTSIRDQIHARDLVSVLSQAGSLEQLQAVLEDAAADFGYLGMEVCREMSAGRHRILYRNGVTSRGWRFDYPIVECGGDDDPIVLRIWSDPKKPSRLRSAERVAEILAPAIEERIDTLRLQSAFFYSATVY